MASLLKTLIFVFLASPLLVLSAAFDSTLPVADAIVTASLPDQIEPIASAPFYDTLFYYFCCFPCAGNAIVSEEVVNEHDPPQIHDVVSLNESETV